MIANLFRACFVLPALGSVVPAPAQPVINLEMSRPGATCRIIGTDAKLVLEARSTFAKSAEGLDLQQPANRQEFLARYWKARKQRPEFGKLTISCVEFPLVEPSAAPRSESSGGSGHSESARRELEAILAAPEPESPNSSSLLARLQATAGGSKAESLDKWIAEKLSPENAATVAEFYMRAFGGPSAIDNMRAVCEWHMGRAISYPDPKAPAPAPQKSKSKSPPEPPSILVGSCNKAHVAGLLLTECHVKAGADVYVAYRIENWPVRTARVKFSESPVEPTKATPAGVLHAVATEPDLEELIRAPLLRKLTDYHNPPNWPKLKKGDPELPSVAVEKFCSDWPTSWIVASDGSRAADIGDLPEGGYVARGPRDNILGVLGDKFAVSRTDTLAGFKDGAGVLYPLPVSAYTYRGKDGKFHSHAWFDNRYFAFRGVWSDGVDPSAAGFLDPKSFRVLGIAAGGAAAPE